MKDFEKLSFYEHRETIITDCTEIAPNFCVGRSLIMPFEKGNIVTTPEGAGQITEIVKWQEGEAMCAEYFVQIPYKGTFKFTTGELRHY